jgi:putative NADH-flavin reductase
MNLKTAVSRMNVVVLGAAGQLGRAMAQALEARGHAVTAFVRRAPEPAFPESVRLYTGDARNAKHLREALEGNAIVVNAIGAGTLRRNDVESTTTAAAVKAAEEAGAARYFAMSAGMVAWRAPVFQYILRPLVFRNIYAEHMRVEQLVQASSLNWTIVRPPKLTNGGARGYIASLEQIPPVATTARADVADFVAQEIGSAAFCMRAVFLWSRPR